MKLEITSVPEGTRHVSPLHYSKIGVKCQAYDIEKFVLNDSVKSLLWKMTKTCLLDDGIGLAAPQIGVFKRLFLIRDMDANGVPLESFTAYFNPSFKALTSDKVEDLEGCLSVPGGCYTVARYLNIQATWWELDNDKLVKRECLLSGYQARVFQHEFDHLNGVSIVQRGTKVSK